ncbi:MAG: 4Fe-4S dicluster domain-containing protein [bacterium]|nr:4Fe-4S dicluster domain-containing protein [bacterium]
MCGTIFTSMKKKSSCEMYPVKPSRSYEKTRGSIKIDATKCTLCTLCDKRCPTHAIKVDREAGYWEINRGKCILCKECVHACRPGSLTMENQYMAPTGTIQIDKVDIEKKVPKKKPAAPAAKPVEKAESKPAPVKKEAPAKPAGPKKEIKKETEKK